MKKTTKKIGLNTERVRDLTADETKQVQGGISLAWCFTVMSCSCIRSNCNSC